MIVAVDSLDNILNRFDPITLQQMDSVKLLDRVDTKFMFRAQQLSSLLERMMNDYYVLEISGKRYTNYETLYFDTEKFDLYLRHHNGKVNRFKFRARRYVESNLNFFEVKFKNNKGRTIKDRIKRPQIDMALSDASDELVRDISNVDPASLKAKLWINYRRMTFVSKHTEERLTIDTKLTFIDERQTIPVLSLVIAEVKRGNVREKSRFIDIMKEFHVKEKSISKYCLGVISLNSNIKQNNFKPTILYLKKLLRNAS